MHNKKIFLLVLSTLVLAACSNKPDTSSSNNVSSSSETTSQSSVSSTSSSSSVAQSSSITDTSTSSESSQSSISESSISDTTSSSSSSSIDPLNTWKTEEIDLMESIVGDAIPYVKLADDYICTFETDNTGNYLYIYDESTTNLLTGYGTILENAGYTYDGEEASSDGSYTAYYYVKDDIVIQYNFVPGNDTYPSGNEIYAWIDIGGVQTTDTSWPEELSSAMVSMYGEALPFVALDAAYYYNFDETSKELIIADDCETDYLTQENYGQALIDAGFTFEGTDNSDGYAVSTYSKVLDENNQLIVTIDFYPGDDIYSSGNEIYAYVDNGGPTGGVQTTDTSWPEELSSVMVSMYGEALPFVALDAAYYYNFDETTKEVLIADDCETDYLTQENYGQALIDAGFTFEEVDNSNGYDVSTYTKALDENYQIIVTFDFFPGNESYSSGNEIYAYVDEIINPVTSTTWPSEQIDTLLGAPYNIPSFVATGDYTYYTYAGGLYISGIVDADITEAYETQAKENGLVVANLQTYTYIYNWEENFMISYEFNPDDSSFAIYILPSQPTYDSLVDTFPTDQIVTFLGEGKTEVPAFNCMEGSNYKVTMVEADPEYGLTAYLMISAIDNGTIGTDSIEDKYVAILEDAGWTVDNTDYENSGYIATNANDNVTLTFFTLDGLFYFYVEDTSSIVTDITFDLSMSKDQVTTDTADKVVYTSGQYVLTIDKASSQVVANNYLGNGSDHHETRVYKGQTMTIEATEGTLGTVVIELSSSTDAEAFNSCVLTNCTATIEGTTVTLTPTEGATSITISASNLSAKRLNLLSITVL